MELEIEKGPVIHITHTILYNAVLERASDVHIEPKENFTTLRFRIDGDMREMFSFNNITGVMVLTRLKSLAGLDIAENRKPQDGTIEAVIDEMIAEIRRHIRARGTYLIGHHAAEKREMTSTGTICL